MKGTGDKTAFSNMSVLQLDQVQRKPLFRGKFVNIGIRNIEVISVFHCGGRTLLGCETVCRIRSGQKRNGNKAVEVSLRRLGRVKIRYLSIITASCLASI